MISILNFLYAINLLPHNTAFWHTKDIELSKTLWEKEKLQVKAIFPFLTMFFFPYMVLIMHFKISSSVCFIFDQSKILSGNGLRESV